jgi:SAM-dependent methyltransferase
MLFHDVVNLPDSYYHKYEHPPKCPLASWKYSWANKDYPRVWCVLDFREWIQHYGISHPKHLGLTCNSDPELEFLFPQTSSLLSYPKYDLHTVDHFFRSRFDFFLFNQTIEHLHNPFKALRSIYNIVTPGGYVFTSVPTLNIPHMTPVHFNGYTPMGLAALFKSTGFDVMQIGQWGCLKYIQLLWSTHKWPDYTALAINNFIPNERQNVCQCWILAKKPRSMLKHSKVVLSRLFRG